MFYTRMNAWLKVNLYNVGIYSWKAVSLEVANGFTKILSL